jgi:hypothetical protein
MHSPTSIADPTAEVYAGQRRADALGLVAESALAAGLDPGSRGDRYQVVVHVDAEALAAGSESGSSCMADGSHVSVAMRSSELWGVRSAERVDTGDWVVG